MNKDKITAFQKLDRMEQLKSLIADKVQFEGYTIEDFVKEYNASELDQQDFKKIIEEMAR